MSSTGLIFTIPESFTAVKPITKKVKARKVKKGKKKLQSFKRPFSFGGRRTRRTRRIRK